MFNRSDKGSSFLPGQVVSVEKDKIGRKFNIRASIDTRTIKQEEAKKARQKGERVYSPANKVPSISIPLHLKPPFDKVTAESALDLFLAAAQINTNGFRKQSMKAGRPVVISRAERYSSIITEEAIDASPTESARGKLKRELRKHVL